MAIVPFRENFGLQSELGANEMDSGKWKPFFQCIPNGQCWEEVATGAAAGDDETLP